MLWFASVTLNFPSEIVRTMISWKIKWFKSGFTTGAFMNPSLYSIHNILNAKQIRLMVIVWCIDLKTEDGFLMMLFLADIYTV